MNKYYIDRILAIIADCEDIQKSNESVYTKQVAKISAYDDIKEILRSEQISESTECSSCRL